MKSINLKQFVAESNRIENIHEIRPGEIEAHKHFLNLKTLTVKDVEELVFKLQPGAFLRERVGQDVIVGDYRPPPGGEKIRIELEELLIDINENANPWHSHIRYENLHPFMDGNGRSGRAIWLWQIIRNYEQLPVYNFLQYFYYQTLNNSQTRR